MAIAVREFKRSRDVRHGWLHGEASAKRFALLRGMMIHFLGNKVDSLKSFGTDFFEE